MKKFIKGRWFPVIAAIAVFVLVTGVVLTMMLFGWRFTYAPELQNQWTAITAVATWAGVVVSICSVIASIIAIRAAIKVPQKIANQQNRISLFEKRFHIYELLTFLCTFSKCVNVAENVETAREMFLVAFEKNMSKEKDFKDFDYFFNCYRNIFGELRQSEFLFSHEISAGILDIADKLSAFIGAIAMMNPDQNFEVDRDNFVATHGQICNMMQLVTESLNLSE